MLKGEKVILRALEREDLARVWAYNNDTEVELAGGGDPPMPQSLARLESEFEDGARRGGRDGSNFAIEADGRIIGQCGLRQPDGLVDTTAQVYELGIAIGDKVYWGRGYGRDAVRVLLDYAFRLRNAHKVWLKVNATNERGLRAYRACGFIEEGRLRQHVWGDGRHIDLVLMGILRTEWSGSRAGVQ
ncbi:MAG: GNAT family N-acetyltransferase [Chloroflexi bacterium]|nr:GNAT family N-acetyltransferase [Chloroflexota bacterium]